MNMGAPRRTFVGLCTQNRELSTKDIYKPDQYSRPFAPGDFYGTSNRFTDSACPVVLGNIWWFSLPVAGKGGAIAFSDALAGPLQNRGRLNHRR